MLQYFLLGCWFSPFPCSLFFKRTLIWVSVFIFFSFIFLSSFYFFNNSLWASSLEWLTVINNNKKRPCLNFLIVIPHLVFFFTFYIFYFLHTFCKVFILYSFLSFNLIFQIQISLSFYVLGKIVWSFKIFKTKLSVKKRKTKLAFKKT